MKEKEKTVKNNAPTREMSMEEKMNDYVEKETFSDLIKYAKKGDRSGFLSTMDIYLNNKYDVNRRDSCLWKMLHHAVNEGNFIIVDVLLKTKINLQNINNNNQTTLHISVNQGYFDITKKLIERGSNFNCLDNEKNNVLHLCAAGGHFELMKYLLEINLRYILLLKKNMYGKTPKDFAKEENIVKLLTMS